MHQMGGVFPGFSSEYACWEGKGFSFVLEQAKLFTQVILLSF